MKKLLPFLALAIFAVCHVHAEDIKFTVGEFSFKAEAPWTESQNAGMMTSKVLAFPVKDSKPLEAKFYFFSGGGGGVEANVKRWIGQFEPTPEVKQEELPFADGKVILLTATGTFLDGAMMSPTKTPHAGYTLLGAIVVGKDAPVFIKLTGPKADTDAAKDAFKKLVTSPFGK